MNANPFALFVGRPATSSPAAPAPQPPSTPSPASTTSNPGRFSHPLPNTTPVRHDAPIPYPSPIPSLPSPCPPHSPFDTSTSSVTGSPGPSLWTPPHHQAKQASSSHRNASGSGNGSFNDSGHDAYNGVSSSSATIFKSSKGIGGSSGSLSRPEFASLIATDPHPRVAADHPHKPTTNHQSNTASPYPGPGDSAKGSRVGRDRGIEDRGSSRNKSPFSSLFSAQSSSSNSSRSQLTHSSAIASLPSCDAASSSTDPQISANSATGYSSNFIPLSKLKGDSAAVASMHRHDEPPKKRGRAKAPTPIPANSPIKAWEGSDGEEGTSTGRRSSTGKGAKKEAKKKTTKEAKKQPTGRWITSAGRRVFMVGSKKYQGKAAMQMYQKQKDRNEEGEEGTTPKRASRGQAKRGRSSADSRDLDSEQEAKPVSKKRKTTQKTQDSECTSRLPSHFFQPKQETPTSGDPDWEDTNSISEPEDVDWHHGAVDDDSDITDCGIDDHLLPSHTRVAGNENAVQDIVAKYADKDGSDDEDMKAAIAASLKTAAEEASRPPKEICPPFQGFKTNTRTSKGHQLTLTCLTEKRKPNPNSSKSVNVPGIVAETGKGTGNIKGGIGTFLKGFRPNVVGSGHRASVNYYEGGEPDAGAGEYETMTGMTL